MHLRTSGRAKGQTRGWAGREDGRDGRRPTSVQEGTWGVGGDDAAGRRRRRDPRVEFTRGRDSEGLVVEYTTRDVKRKYQTRGPILR